MAADRILATLRQRGPLPAAALHDLLAPGDAIEATYAELVHLEAEGLAHVESHAGSADWAAGPALRRAA
ncbi:MAG TPA: hypothetical protein VF457_15695 [Burkholderiaceae bacterium]